MKKILFLLGLLFLTNKAIPQSAFLDSTFNHQGRIDINMGANSGSTDMAYASAIQADGKIIIAGDTWTGSENKFALARCTTNGQLDSSFNHSGKVITAVGSSSVILAIAIQSDGKILASGGSSTNQNDGFLVARYNVDGSIDSSFGNNGIVITRISGIKDAGRSIVIQPDGKILIGGYSGNNQSQDFTLVRYNNNGELDSAFGNGGIVLSSFSNEADGIWSLALQADNKIVAGGYCYINSVPRIALARFENNGNPDLSFGSNGKIVLALNEQGCDLNKLQIQSDNKIVGSVNYKSSSGDEFCLIKLLPDGTFDYNFGNSGVLIDNIGASDAISSFRLNSDNKITVTGKSVNQSENTSDYIIKQYLNNGTTDSAFGINGIIKYPFDFILDFVSGICLQNDGKIILAGSEFQGNPSNFNFMLLRFLPDTNYTSILSPLKYLNYFSFTPNPVLNKMIVEQDRNISAKFINILNLQGQTVKTIVPTEQKSEINLSDLPAGMYLIQLCSDKGCQTQKFIKL